VPFPTIVGAIMNIDNANGSITNTSVVSFGSIGAPPKIQEVSSLCSAPNGNFYFLTLDTVGSTNNQLSAIGFKIQTSYNFDYYIPGYGFGTKQPISATRANGSALYTHNGQTLHKRNLLTGAVLATTSIPGGIINTNPNSGTKTQGNGGLDLDNCGNVYVGSGNGVYKFDSSLNLIASASTSGAVYDVDVAANGEVAASGVNFVASVNLSACSPILFCTSISVQPPSSVSVCSNSSASISISTIGSGLSRQWQKKAPGSTVFTNCTFGGVNGFSGVLTNTLNIANVNGLNGYSFRCIVTSSSMVDTSDVSVLTVNSPATVTTQPTNAVVCSGWGTTFTVGASGTGLTYQWEYGVNTSNFTNVLNGGTNIFSGVNSPVLNVGNSVGLANYYFRCIVSSSVCPPSVFSNTAQLLVSSPAAITTQPTSTTVCSGQNATFSLNATGSGLTYQWQNRSGSTGTWSNCVNGANYSGSASNTLTVSNLSGLSGYQYRCLVNNSCQSPATSSTAVLTVSPTPSASILADGTASSSVTISPGHAVSLQLNGSVSSTSPNIVWSPSTGLSSTTVSDPIAYPSATTTYTATFTNIYGCTQLTSIVVNVSSLPSAGAISVVSGTGVSGFSIFDTLQVQVRLNGVTNIYGAYAKLRYYGALAPYMSYVGYTAGTILGTGSGIISTPPVTSGSYGYDFGISKVGAVLGYSGTGTLYTFLFKPNNVPTSLLGSPICFYVDNLSITNGAGSQVGLTNQGPYCYNFTNQVNVWPGDLDNNKTVNTADILKIGVFYNSTGPVRPNASLQWVAQPSTLWGTNTSSPNSDAYKVFADGNGDGIINNADQTSVGFNMGKIHAYAAPLDSLLDGSGFNRISSTGNLLVTPTPGYVNTSQLPQQVELDVSLANSNGTLDNLYGISFDITADTNVFDLQNTTFDYTGSIFGAPSQDFLSIEYVANGVVSVGMTRFNNASINGNGLLCKVRLNTLSSLNYPDTNLVFNGTVVAANDSSGVPYSINPSTVQVPYGSTAGLSEGGMSDVRIYPNPANEYVQVQMGKEVMVREIRVVDQTGRVAISKSINKAIRTSQVEISKLETGVYTIQIITNNAQFNQKVVKVRK
ncbi:MAG: T9SS type A sorting domain-containing protein, partial [Bacteroidota bacterium]